MDFDDKLATCYFVFGFGLIFALVCRFVWFYWP